MKTLNNTLKVTANKSAKTFTIRSFVNGELIAKYRTIRLSKNEFGTEINNTQNDWFNFLKSSDYYVVK